MQPTPTKPARPRPLSPHLQLYRWQATMTLSILHRMCGVALAVGTLMVVWMLVAAATGPEAYGVFHDFASSKLGTLMLLGWSFALFLHMLSGIRHMFWDMGRGFEIPAALRNSWLVILSAVALTLALWWHVCPWSGN